MPAVHKEQKNYVQTNLHFIHWAIQALKIDVLDQDNQELLQPLEVFITQLEQIAWFFNNFLA